MPQLIIWPESDYTKLEEEIRDLVKALHLLGIRTIMSCEGHIRSSPIYTGILPWPWVIVVLDPEDRALLERKLDSWNQKNPWERWMLSEKRIHPSFTPKYIASMIGNDFPGCIIRAFCPEEENQSLDESVLLVHQLQSIALADFLRKEQ